ncbi:phosphoglycerate mutase [Clostridiaceae bacterium]|nr:phosphoglycerate mutase [Clostridiaceae bacterium]RKI13398.1 phosphoglycerate mutase [bacterium 1XD21-70]
MEYRNRTVYRNTKIKKIYLYLIHSNPIRAILGGIFPVEKSRMGKEWGKEFNGTTRNFAI